MTKPILTIAKIAPAGKVFALAIPVQRAGLTGFSILAGAFRLGMIVGEAGETDLSNPYTTDRTRTLYEDGVKCGLRTRESRLARLREEGEA